MREREYPHCSTRFYVERLARETRVGFVVHQVRSRFRRQTKRRARPRVRRLSPQNYRRRAHQQSRLISSEGERGRAMAIVRPRKGSP